MGEVEASASFRFDCMALPYTRPSAKPRAM
jgi:hypothetical protein